MYILRTYSNVIIKPHEVSNGMSWLNNPSANGHKLNSISQHKKQTVIQNLQHSITVSR